MWVMITLYHISIILDTYQYFTDIGTSLHLFPKSTLDKRALNKSPKLVYRFMNNKQLMSRENTYLGFKDGGTGTPNLYTLYMVSEVTWIVKLIR